MVRLRIGPTAVNTSNLSVDWPNNPWQGLLQNATTASITAQLNGDIIDAGGCGQLIEPTGGVLPANALVVLVTSYNLDTNANQFGPITNDIYILYQNNPSTIGGHFANSGTGLRTLQIAFGACSDTVTYDRAQLINQTGGTSSTNADGSTVEFDAAGNPTYINNGCAAPVPPFTVNAGSPVAGCPGATVSLAGSAENYQSVVWSASSGTFSNSGSLSTQFTIPANATGTLVVTLTATNSCGAEVSDTVNVTVTAAQTPNFTSPMSLCSGAVPPTLATTSPNGITGSWSPSNINTSTSGSYVFTPTTGQCASPFTLQVNVTPATTPNFTSPLTLCQGSIPPVLATTSPNGVTGTWSPSAIDTTTNGSYLFTPNTGQCAAPFTLQVNVGTLITPDFPTTLAICGGDPVPVLAATSPNGVTGTWSPAVVSATTTANYVFTPNAGQCAVPHTLHVDVTTPVAPDFPTTLSFCQGAVVPSLDTTSPNGITGTWSPATINTSLSGNYLFTPGAGQCAVPHTLAVAINPLLTPNFATPLTVCSGGVAPILEATSPNGITGTWSPSTINTSANGSYVFTPTVGQCASPFTLFVQVEPIITPDFATTLWICQGDSVPPLLTTSPNGISGSWIPSVIDNNANGSYVFTPNTGECATPITLQVTVTPTITPSFMTPILLCQGAVAPVLQAVSPNGITGSWSPAIVDTAVSGNYVFTPAAGQCAVPFTLQVEVQTATVPSFTSPLTICDGVIPPALPTTSPNGITGNWSPSVIDPAISANYVFTPDPDQCATSFTLQVTVNAMVAPDFTSPISVCQGSSAPTLATISPNGITGTWAPATVDTAVGATYIFTPDSGQCASPFTLQVNVTPSVTPDFPPSITFCEGTTPPVLSASSPNGITGVWTPAVIDNQVNGTYMFVPDAGQCAAPVSLQVTVAQPVEPDFDVELTLCNGQTPPVLATVSPNGISGTWTPSVIDGTQSATYTFVPDVGQCAVPTILEVTIGTISVTVAEGCDGLQYLLSAQLPTGTDPNMVDYTWRNGTSIVGTDPTLNVTELARSGGLTFPTAFELTVTTPEGCSSSQSYPVAGINCGIPRGISPNGDSKNDVFDLTGFGVAHITIFNRYGVEVYSRANYTNQWDGHTNDGQELPSATYYYVIDRTDGRNFSGWVYINR